jgi:hypothetical protein
LNIVKESLRVTSDLGNNTLVFEGTGLSDSYGLTITGVSIIALSDSMTTLNKPILIDSIEDIQIGQA